MAEFNLQGNFDDPENVLSILENLNNDMSNVEDRIKRLDEQGFEVSLSVNGDNLDKEDKPLVSIDVQSK